jgi:uncharacterized membrane protein YkvI
MVHAVNERVAQSMANANKSFPGSARATIAATIMVLSVVAADKIGLVALVATGYSYMAWAFIGIFLVPIMTYGLWRLAHTKGTPLLAKDPVPSDAS